MRELIKDNARTILVSAASAWEVATKHRLGKLPGAAAIALDTIRGPARCPATIVTRSIAC